MPRRVSLAALLFLGLALLGGEVRADVVFEEDDACGQKHRAGDACTYYDGLEKRTGTC